MHHLKSTRLEGIFPYQFISDAYSPSVSSISGVTCFLSSLTFLVDDGKVVVESEKIH